MGWFKKYQRLVEFDENKEEEEKVRAEAQASSFPLHLAFNSVWFYAVFSGRGNFKVDGGLGGLPCRSGALPNDLGFPYGFRIGYMYFK